MPRSRSIAIAPELPPFVANPFSTGRMELATPRVEVDDEIDRTLLEVYAALSLHTTEEHGGFNSFETH